MKITSEMVADVLKETESYARKSFGIPNGPDFPDFARTLAGSKELAHEALMYMLGVVLAQHELKEEALQCMAANDREAAAQIGVNSGLFQGYATAVYIGYLLGKRVGEVEALESLGKVK